MAVIVIGMIVLALVALAAFTGVVMLDDEPPDRARAAPSERAPAPRPCDMCEGRTDACRHVGSWPVQRYSMPEHDGVDAYPVETWLCHPCAYMTAEALSEYVAGVAALERSDEPDPPSELPAGTDR